MDATDPHPARRLWNTIEPLHAVTYFSPSARSAADAAGLRGFWMSYVAQRSAPLGPVSPDVVTAVFFGFSPARITRALPAAWERIAPAAVVTMRADAAAQALTETVDGLAAAAGQVIPLLSSVVRAASGAGRPLFAANRSLPLPEDPVAALWQLCTTLREHRGDGHVAALVAHGVGAAECHLLATADPEDLRGRLESRAWSADDGDAARERLTGRGLSEEDGTLTEAGRELLRSIEESTDASAWRAWTDGLTPEGIDLVLRVLRPVAQAIWDSGMIPHPNPMGLTPL